MKETYLAVSIPASFLLSGESNLDMSDNKKVLQRVLELSSQHEYYNTFDILLVTYSLWDRHACDQAGRLRDPEQVTISVIFTIKSKNGQTMYLNLSTSRSLDRFG